MQHLRQQILTIKCKHCGNFFEGFAKRTVCNDCATTYRRKPVQEVQTKGYKQYLAERAENPINKSDYN